jgi:hypothetical protein
MLAFALVSLAGCGGLYTDKTYAQFLSGGYGTGAGPGSTQPAPSQLKFDRVLTRALNDGSFTVGPGPSLSGFGTPMIYPSTQPFNTVGNSSYHIFSNSPFTNNAERAEMIAAFSADPGWDFSKVRILRINGEAVGGQVAAGGCGNVNTIPTLGTGLTIRLWRTDANSFSSANFSTANQNFTSFAFDLEPAADIRKAIYTDTSQNPQQNYYLVSLRSNDNNNYSAFCSGVGVRSLQVQLLP